MKKLYLQFTRAENGNTAIMVSLLLPLFLMLCGGAVDFTQYTLHRSELQKTADAVALAGARKFTLAGTQTGTIQAFVINEIDYLIGQSSNKANYTTDVSVSEQDKTVTATITQNARMYLLKDFLNETITVSSEAIATGTVKLCALGLNETTPGTISLTGESRLSANECSIFSNSNDPAGIDIEMDAFLGADVICSSGGVSGDSENVNNDPITDCPVYEDPLKGAVNPPYIGMCDETDFEVGIQDRDSLRDELSDLFDRSQSTGTSILSNLDDFNSYTLSPGTYCGGLHVHDWAKVKFEPGTYIIKDGGLTIDKRADLSGEHLTFYMTGTDATLFIGRDASVNFTASKNGNLAGILFMEDPSSPEGREFTIASTNARVLLGTFYLPKGTLVVDTDETIASDSAYTVIVANKIQLKGQPSLVLNSDYASTDIPVPSGVGPIGGSTYLRK